MELNIFPRNLQRYGKHIQAASAQTHNEKIKEFRNIGGKRRI